MTRTEMCPSTEKRREKQCKKEIIGKKTSSESTQIQSSVVSCRLHSHKYRRTHKRSRVKEREREEQSSRWLDTLALIWCKHYRDTCRRESHQSCRPLSEEFAASDRKVDEEQSLKIVCRVLALAQIKMANYDMFILSHSVCIFWSKHHDIFRETMSSWAQSEITSLPFAFISCCAKTAAAPNKTSSRNVILP